MVRTLCVAMVLATTWGGLPAPAAAQSGSDGEVSDEARDEARSLYRRGRRLLERNKPDEALEEFARAYALYPHWATSNSMGVCHDRLSRPSDALRLYEQALREGGDEIPERQREEIATRISALRIQLGIRDTATGTVRVTTTPGGARIWLDGSEVGVSPMDVDADPGPHQIEVVLEGYSRSSLTITVERGQTAMAAVALVEERVDRNGRLVCTSDPVGARVLVDGSEIGRTPATLPVLSAGEHLVRFDLPDGRSLEERVDVPVDGTARVSVRFGGGVHQGWFWTVAGTALALGAGAAGTGAYGTLLWDEFNDSGTTRARQEEIQPTGQDLMLTTDVLAGAAGAMAVAALVLAFFTDFEGTTEPVATVSFDGVAADPAEFPIDLPDEPLAEPADGDAPAGPDAEPAAEQPTETASR
ncbi:MAG: PEGA domain-containing protein [Deltaproteobacteria bacterium]|nr:PEGA domain-containing protein [Deltaproteobacteria bacterium]